ncbi:hypothetical protein Cgig2_016184 [Carnegiea gigantea]|uniref:DUF7806 domain-containing protein n=1 Tax=Carnegiea gigantea TaxID=171969 RepID=A0A9Q1KQ42_9CARY|nr:hypothetical protein Cgig2_016184 [Carnegiea gigantea]
MEALYIKLYEKYSKLKASKDAKLDKINQDQEVKFVEFVSAAETLIEHLTSENKRLCQTIDELRNEVRSLRAAKDQQFDEFQEHLVEEKQKNQKLSAEIEQLCNIQHEGIIHNDRTDRQEVQNVNNVECSPPVSGDQLNGSPRRMTRKRASEFSPHVSVDQLSESPMRMTRKRARLFASTDSALNGAPASPHVDLSTGRGLLEDHPEKSVSNVHAPQPACCQFNIDSGGVSANIPCVLIEVFVKIPPTCLLQNLVEWLIGMKVSIVDQPEGRCIRVMHQSSGYSFSLTWMDKAAPCEGELLYNVSSLGTFAQVAPEWMREVIIFSMSMCPIFFERYQQLGYNNALHKNRRQLSRIID